MNLNIIRLIDYYIGTIIIKLLYLFKKRKYIHVNFNPKRILLIKFFGFGNLIMTSPIIEQVKKKYPDSKIDYLTLKNNKGILEGYSNLLNKVIYLEMNGLKIIKETFKKTFQLKKKYDLVIDLDQFARYSALLTFIINPKISIGYKTKGAKRHLLYDYKIQYKANKHVVEEFFNLLKPLKISINKNFNLIKLKTNKIIKNKIKSWLKERKLYNKKIIGMHIGTSENATQRKWPYFDKLIEKIIKKNNKIKIILTAGPNEYEECQALITKLNLNKKLIKNIIISKDINLRELPELINHMKIFISNDTGPIHLAAAQGIKVIGLYGPNTPLLYGPYTKNKTNFYKRLECSPCITNFNNKHYNCRNPICMKKITVEEVYNAIFK